MRNYFSQNENTKKNNLLKIMILILLSIAVTVFIAFIFAFIISNTGMSEKSESLITIVLTALLCISVTAVLVLCTELKGIYCSLISFALIILLKLICNLMLSVPITWGKQGILGVVFSFLFCVAGGIITSNIKK